MLTVPNQKTFIVVKDKGNPSNFLQIHLDNLHYAGSHLSPAAFRAYLDIVANQDSFNYIWSPALISQSLKIGIDSAKHIRGEFEKKGFLINQKFYERPPIMDEELKKEKEKVRQEHFNESDF